MALKIHYDTVKHQKSHMTSFLWRHKDYVTENTSSCWRHKIFPFSSLSKQNPGCAPGIQYNFTIACLYSVFTLKATCIPTQYDLEYQQWQIGCLNCTGRLKSEHVHRMVRLSSISMKTIEVRLYIKGALNPNFLNLTKNREKFCL